MNPRKGKRTAAAAVVLGVLVILILAFLFRDSIPGWAPAAPAASRGPLPRSPGFTGRVDIAQGSILVREFAGFLESFTGLSVVVESEVAQKPVIVATSIENADGEIVRTLLESSGCVVERKTLPNGRETLLVRAAEKE